MSVMCYGFDKFSEASYAAWDIQDAWTKKMEQKFGGVRSIRDFIPIPCGVYKCDREIWDDMMDTNTRGMFFVSRSAAKVMAGQKDGGAIVNISSVVGEFGNIGQANYAAAKAGIMGLTRSWAKEFARKGAAVRVNCIAPGYTMTDMLKTVPQDLLDKFASLTMLGRLGQPEEIASAALFLVSDEASYITGQVLSVNGGMRL